MEVIWFLPSVYLIVSFQEILEYFLKQVELVGGVSLLQLVKDVSIAASQSMFPAQLVASREPYLILNSFLESLFLT